MNEQEIDKHVRDLFLSQKLSAEKVQNILDESRTQARSTTSARNNTWWKYWMPVAAAAAVVMALSFQLARNQSPSQEEFYFDVAGEIAMRHNAYSNFDVKAATFDGVQNELEDLGFSVTPLMKQKILSAYEVLGARYCQLQGQQAAHVQVRNRSTGALCTLYIAALKGPLSALKSADRSVDLEANHVDLWEDSDRLFALVD